MTSAKASPRRITVVGSGAWGTALACAMARAGSETTLVCRSKEQASELNLHRTNRRYLGDIHLADRFGATTDARFALSKADIVVLAIPVQVLGPALRGLSDLIPADAILVNTAKGMERATGRRLSDVIGQACPDNALAVLSGPSFARDVARGLPTAVTLAMEDIDAAIDLANRLSCPSFRLYASNDVLGVELGGALKNVLALAAGMIEGRGLGDSAKAALITRGFVELLRIGRRMGALDETLMGLSGFGDLQLTCGSLQSRNYSYGVALGRGQDVSDLPLAEGVATADVAADLVRDLGLDAPIIAAVKEILAGETSLNAAVEALMTRPLKTEARG